VGALSNLTKHKGLQPAVNCEGVKHSRQNIEACKVVLEENKRAQYAVVGEVFHN